MRPKLVVAVSTLAALLGAGSSIGIVFAVFSSLTPVTKPGLLVAATFILPIAAIGFASVFVYRHTPRKRKLQALITAVLATLLTITLFVLATILAHWRNSMDQPPVPTHTSD
jgi:uncharacterized membrane protein